MQLPKEVFEHVVDNIYRLRKENGKFRYYIQVECSVCGMPFLTDKYKPSSGYCSDKCRGNSRGRPIGYKLSQESISTISDHMMGHIQTHQTREKISNGVYKAHEAGIGNYSHGLSRENIYKRYYTIKSRCENPRSSGYKYYGGRGIKISEEWADFENFARWAEENDLVDSKHLHRVDHNKDYGPDNCVVLDASIHSRLHNYMRYNGGSVEETLKYVLSEHPDDVPSELVELLLIQCRNQIAA